MGIARREKSSVESGAASIGEACSIMIRYPHLWEFLTASTFEDGSARTLPSMTLFGDGRLLKACVNDKAEGTVAFVTGTTLQTILEALEEGLAGDCLDWRRSVGGGKKR